jgi:nucleotide-binding universal stress UspA family protein
MSTELAIRHILVAHDFEEISDVALDYALGLARMAGARVTVLHVYEIPSVSGPEVLVLATDWLKQIGTLAKDKLDKIVARVREDSPPLDADVREGSVWREVDAFARERKVDLIVVGSHSRRGLRRALLGSVAEKIVRTATCPVLVVHPPK